MKSLFSLHGEKAAGTPGLSGWTANQPRVALGCDVAGADRERLGNRPSWRTAREPHLRDDALLHPQPGSRHLPKQTADLRGLPTSRVTASRNRRTGNLEGTASNLWQRRKARKGILLDCLVLLVIPPLPPRILLRILGSAGDRGSHRRPRAGRLEPDRGRRGGGADPDRQIVLLRIANFGSRLAKTLSSAPRF